MWYSVILIAILFIAAFVGFTGYAMANDNKYSSEYNQLSRNELAYKLMQLPDNPRIALRQPNAMCYSMVMLVDYTCPVCKSTTGYSMSYQDDINRIRRCRTIVNRIKKIEVKLDDTQYCKKCNPDIKSPQLCLMVKYGKNPKTHKTCGITENDINLLYEFSEGIKEHKTPNGKLPLNNYKGRLEELIGIKLKN
jgi:hypothetical protein